MARTVPSALPLAPSEVKPSAETAGIPSTSIPRGPFKGEPNRDEVEKSGLKKGSALGSRPSAASSISKETGSMRFQAAEANLPRVLHAPQYKKANRVAPVSAFPPLPRQSGRGGKGMVGMQLEKG